MQTVTPEAIQSVDELIALTEKKLVLLRELRAALDLAARAGVHPRDVAASGYDPSTDDRWKKYPNHLRHGGAIRPVTNFVKLKDGTRVELPIDWKAELEKFRRHQKARNG